MLSHEDNMLMCLVGPDTPMGRALRRYWVPVLSSYQLPEPDADPVRVEIFGERLVAFRDTNGVVGILDEHCCHRSASLALGRVEGCGIRCLFHGWKFAVDGTVMETPNISDPKFRTRVRARAYPTREAGGLIWTYVGPKEQEPPFPHWRYFDYPEERRLSVTFVVPCNYVQVQEALLDSSHLTILHQDSFKQPAKADIDFVANVNNVTAAADPKVEAEETEFGFHYVAIRPKSTTDGVKNEARVTSYFAPFHVLNANGDFVGIIVPIDDHHTLHHFVWWSDDKEIAKEPLASAQLNFVGLDEKTLHAVGLHPKTWFEPGKPNRNNNFLQDRNAMRNDQYSGLPKFFPEDSAVLTSSGIIRDRSCEALVPADAAISRLYRTLLGIARKSQRGEEPIGLSSDPMLVRGLHGIVEDGKSWQSLLPSHLVKNEPIATAISR
jgi:phthalate 4,5-dioxygenase oxygenase subunit